MLAIAPDVDAIFCSSDLLAIGVLTEARVRGIAIPERIALLGFGDAPFVADMVPALSTVHINGANIGKLAARYLIDRADDRPVEQRVVDVGVSILERETPTQKQPLVAFLLRPSLVYRNSGVSGKGVYVRV